MTHFTENPIENLKSSIDSNVSNIVIVVTDNDCLIDFANKLFSELSELKKTTILSLPDGECSKNLKTVELIWNSLINLNSTRNTLIIGIGGGTTLDVVAFCASTFMRGISFWSIPTTLLAMVDASIGGKTAINFNSYKNYIGTFYMADKVWINVNFIKSLSKKELRNGWAECIKHALIIGGELWSKVESMNFDLSDESIKMFWTPLIMENALYKEDIVARDFQENSLREVLNAGHTFAHAIESYSIRRDRIIPHGQAVAWGLLFETLVGNNVSVVDFEGFPNNHWLKILYNIILEHFAKLPRISKIDFEELHVIAKKDKKNRNGYLSASVILEPGKFVIQKEIDFRKIYMWIEYFNNFGTKIENFIDMNNKKNIEDFISKEELYFKPMLERQNKYTNDELELFRNETVRERKSRISNEIFHQCKESVQYGPFVGLKLTSNTWWGGNDLGSMCLGLYEKEVVDFLFSEELDKRDSFVDIGAADGYYAIGLLRAKRVKSALCFELTSEGRSTIEKNWKLNGSPGILEIYGDVFIDFQSRIRGLDLSKSIVLIDIEGAEFLFLDSTVLTILTEAIIIIEVHNWIPNFVEAYSAFLRNADNFFDVEILNRTEKNTFQIEELRSLTDDNRLLITSESRPCVMRFLVLRPKK